MANNFQQWQGDGEGLDDILNDIEQKVLHQAHTLSHFGRVIELFVPNALQTAAHLIAGTRQTGGPRRQSGVRYSGAVIPEGRPPSGGGGADDRLLPSDKEII